MTTFQEFREEVRARNDIVRVAGWLGLEVKRAGRLQKASCPFHTEKTPSFTLYPDQGRWHCYGCGKNGDLFDLVEQMRGIPHREAVEFLAQQAGVAVPEWKPEDAQAKAARIAADGLLAEAARFYHEQLLKNAKADAHRDYLRGRGFGEDVWKRWQAGATGKANGLLAHFRSIGADLALAEKTGLIRAGDGGALYDYFRDRVIIPTLVNGRVAMLTGRAIRPELQPKYLHLPNSELAAKTIYGRPAERAVVVVEGQLDAWAVDMLAGDGVGVIALMGLAHSDKALATILQRRDVVYVALDSDDAGQAAIDAMAEAVGFERARILSWQPHKDAGEFLEKGGKAEDFAAMLVAAPTWTEWTLTRIRQAADKTAFTEQAIAAARTMEPLRRDSFLAQIKQAVKGVINAKTINQMAQAPVTEEAPKPSNGKAYYFVQDGEIWRDEGKDARRVLAGGMARVSEQVLVDDGQDTELMLNLEIVLRNGRTIESRIRAEDSGSSGALIRALKGAAGVLVSIGAGEDKHICPAIDAVSVGAVQTMTEIARTGWLESEAGLAFVTPGGVVGKIPSNCRVEISAKDTDLTRFAVVDSGPEAFEAGMRGLVQGFLRAFNPDVTLPLLSFALLPVAARWMPTHKFAVHLSGETGSLKSETSRILCSFYGAAFVDTPPLMNWRSTINAIEQAGWFLPDVIGLVDDYKPSLVQPWAYTDLIHRYADQNARLRLTRDSKMQRRQAMRCWILSNGEDIPTGESSVRARMVMLRMPKRGDYNAELRMASRLAKHFPTITAKYAAWLMENGVNQGLDSRMELAHQTVLKLLTEKAPDTPNLSRIARNIAMLSAHLEVLALWLLDVMPMDLKGQFWDMWSEWGEAMPKMALNIAGIVAEEKPVRRFLETLQEGIDSGRFYFSPKQQAITATGQRAGFYDDQGVYVLPSMYNEVARWLRESGQQIGFSRAELYRLLKEDGWLIPGRDDAPTISIRAGVPGQTTTMRVLHLRRDALALGRGEDRAD